jgi:hypothetical protein
VFVRFVDRFKVSAKINPRNYTKRHEGGFLRKATAMGLSDALNPTL